MVEIISRVTRVSQLLYQELGSRAGRRGEVAQDVGITAYKVRKALLAAKEPCP
jgi:DNA-directed RNA polymerase sigma subunit (sigma70/sigma32)